MSAHKRAIEIFESERAIVDVVYRYIDRMLDPSESDPFEKSAAEFAEAVKPSIERNIRAVSDIYSK